MSFVLLFVGFALLLFSADWLVDGSSSLARRFNIPNIVVGLTIVAFGTSAPELVVSLISAINGNSELALTNVLGSNIINTYVILGISALIFPLACAKNTFRYEIPMSMMAAVAVLLFATDCFGFLTPGVPGISRVNGIMLLLIFCGFLGYTIYQGMNSDVEEVEDNKPNMSFWKAMPLIVLGLTGLIIGGHLIVKNAVIIAVDFGVPESIIGVTIVAFGTSLPELATSAVAAFKKNTDLAIGNVIGSNIFNVFMVLGLSATIAPLKAYDNLIVDASMAAIASLILLLFVGISKKRAISRWSGVILLLIYIAYLVWLLR